jgi:hypothetical protein
VEQHAVSTEEVVNALHWRLVCGVADRRLLAFVNVVVVIIVRALAALLAGEPTPLESVSVRPRVNAVPMASVESVFSLVRVSACKALDAAPVRAIVCSGK